MKWTCYIICWWGDLLLTYYLQICSAQKTPLQVLTASPEAVLCSSIKHLPSVPKRSYILQTPMADREGRGVISPADLYGALHLVWQHSGGRGCAAASSLGALASSSRDTQHIHSLGSTNPWPRTAHWKHDSKCHIHAPTEKRQQVTWRDRGKKCSPSIFHLPSA